jgi:hypothetical protein
MSVIYYCDAEGCVKKAAGEMGPEGWDSPESWGGGRDDDKIYDTCSPACAEKVADMVAAKEAKAKADAEAEEAESEEQTIGADDVGAISVTDDTQSES